MKFILLILIPSLLLTSCSTMLKKEGRVFIDSSNHADDPPEWAADSKIAWEKDNRIYYKARYTVRGDETVNGCEELAKLDAKQALLSEISNEVRGAIENAQQSINESAENVLGKVRSEKFEGTITGLRFNESYFERFRTGEVERITCYVLSTMTRSDFANLKRSVINRVVQIAPELKAAITKKQVEFFNNKTTSVNEVDEQQ